MKNFYPERRGLWAGGVFATGNGREVRVGPVVGWLVWPDLGGEGSSPGPVVRWDDSSKPAYPAEPMAVVIRDSPAGAQACVLHIARSDWKGPADNDS